MNPFTTEEFPILETLPQTWSALKATRPMRILLCEAEYVPDNSHTTVVARVVKSVCPDAEIFVYLTHSKIDKLIQQTHQTLDEYFLRQATSLNHIADDIEAGRIAKIDIINFSMGMGEVGSLKTYKTLTTLAGEKALSLGICQYQDVIKRLDKMGIRMVFAAGNEGELKATEIACELDKQRGTVSWDAYFAKKAVSSVVIVGRSDLQTTVYDWSDDTLSKDSSTGGDLDSQPDLLAYGTYYGSDKKPSSGTSFSSPLVAGVMLQIKGTRPDLADQQIDTMLKQSAVEVQDAVTKQLWLTTVNDKFFKPEKPGLKFLPPYFGWHQVAQLLFSGVVSE